MRFFKIIFYILFAAIFGIFLIIFFDIFNYQARENLVLSFKAYQKNDLEEFSKYADLDSISMSLIDELFVLEKDLVGETVYDILTMLHGSPNGKPLIKKAVAKALKEVLKASIHHNHVQEKHPKDFDFWDVISIKTNEKVDDALIFTYNFKHNGKDLPVHFRMRKINDEWKLVGITHFKDAIKVYNPLRKKSAEEKEERRKRREERKKHKHHQESMEDSTSEN